MIKEIEECRDEIPFGLSDESEKELSLMEIALSALTTPPAPAIPDGYCLVKKSDVLAVLKPSETSYLGFRIEMTGSMWDAGERMFNAAAQEPGVDAS